VAARSIRRSDASKVLPFDDHQSVVVSAVERDPREPTRICLGPLRE
jgi:hypothetical protein